MYGETGERYTVEFITFRSDLSGEIACGDRKPPGPVFLTWRAADVPGADVPGVAVAVEFLPLKQP